jgi:hypothetical protein
MRAARIALLTGLLATAAAAGDLGDRIKAKGILTEQGTATQYTVKFVSPPLGATAAYATYTEQRDGIDYVTITILRRSPDGTHDVTAIVAHENSATPHLVIQSSGATLRDAYEHMNNGTARVTPPDATTANLYRRYISYLLAPRNNIMAAR